MDVDALRNWGIGVGAVLMAAALGLAVREPEAPPQGLYQSAGGPAPAASDHVGFVVRFQGEGPIARAQALAARGREREAGRAVAAQLRRQSALRGLCFERFTLGGAEIVLRSCAPVALSERAAYQTRWLARLNAMSAVEYADANAVVTQERAPG